MVAKALAGARAANGKPDAAASGTIVARARIRPLATATVLPLGVVAVFAQAEEPDQPYDEQPHVENAEPDHEDPPLGGHSSMLARWPRRGQGERAYFLTGVGSCT